jgi:hypothetical protein
VPINQSQLLFVSLKNARVSTHFHTIHGAGHGRPGFSAPDIEAMVLEFFDRQLKSKSESQGTREAFTTESTAVENADQRGEKKP